MSKRGRGRPKGSGGAAAVIDFTQLKYLLQLAERMDRATYRIQIALLLSYEIGLRASEVSKLRLCDVYTEEGGVRERLQVNGPRSRRVLPLDSTKLRRVLADHFERNIRDRYTDDSALLIRSQRGDGMTPASLARLMTAAHRAAGIEFGSSRSGRKTLRAKLEYFGFVKI